MALREIRPPDHHAVNALWESVWWPTRSEAGWRWLEANPVLRDRPAPQGWVLENDQGEIRVVLGAIAKRFWAGNDAHYALTGHSMVVAPEMRGASRHLITRIMKAPGFFGCYTLNVNALAHKLYPRFGFIAHPAETASIKLAWVLDPLACLMGNALRHALESRPKLARSVGERLMPRRLWQDTPIRPHHDISELTAFDDAYDAFWQKLRSESGLIADRSPEVQTWRMGDPDRTVAPILLKYGRGDMITGYACAMFSKENPIEPLVLEIVDLAALEAAPEAVSSLMVELMHLARRRGAAKMRLQVVSPRLMAQLGPWVKSARREGGWPHCQIYLGDSAPDIAGWSPTPYDGDLFVTLRMPPRRQGAKTLFEPEAPRVAAE